MPIQFGLKQFMNPVFIETGLEKGKGVDKAFAAGFPKVISIEIREHKIMNVKQRYPKRIADKSLVLLHGSSADVMPELLPHIQDSCTFWLDAHFSRRYVNPLTAELKAILDHSRNDHTILIDDLRMFKRWNVDIEEVRALLLKINPDYELRKLRGWRGHLDVLGAIPPKA
jgi:hypothetical protein